jgi:type II secretory pathway pseudopilin PulG
MSASYLRITAIFSVIFMMLCGVSCKREAMHITKAGTTESRMSYIDLCLYMYKSNFGRYPSTKEGLRQLVGFVSTAGEDKQVVCLDIDILDQWGNEFMYLVPGRREGVGYEIVSAGPNGVFGDEDDIGSMQPVK